MNYWSFLPISPGCWVQSIYGDDGEVQRVDGRLYLTRCTDTGRFHYFLRDEIFCIHDSIRSTY